MGTIEEEIEFSKRLLAFEDDWDDDGALACNPEIYHKSIKLLRNYTNGLKSCQPPMINLCRDGSIDLEWQGEGNKVLIVNIVNQAEFEYCFYGREKDKEIKGTIKNWELDSKLRKMIREWKT